MALCLEHARGHGDECLWTTWLTRNLRLKEPNYKDIKHFFHTVSDHYIYSFCGTISTVAVSVDVLSFVLQLFLLNLCSLEFFVFYNPTWALGKSSEIIIHPDKAIYKCKKMILMLIMEIKRNLIIKKK